MKIRRYPVDRAAMRAAARRRRAVSADWIRLSRERVWEYKGHRITTGEDGEPENKKIWHEMVTPEGQTLYPDVDPYEMDRRIVCLWIDAGYPKRQGVGSLTIRDLESPLSVVRTMMEGRPDQESPVSAL